MKEALASLVHQLDTGDVVLALVVALFSGWLVVQIIRLSRLNVPPRVLERASGFASQLGILLGMEQAYEFTRGRIPYRTDIAFMHAYRLLDLEWRHGFFVEARVERFFLPFHTLMTAIDLFYILGHLVVTIAVAVYIYGWRRERYPLLRNMLVVTTGIALIAFYVYPTAPPRFLGNYGLVDPAQVQHLVGAGGAQPGSYTYNPYAAMPSLHVAYALVVSIVLFVSERRLALRALCLLYPVAMAAAVVISGNHWLLDVAGAVLTVALSLLLVGTLSWAGAATRSWLMGTAAVGLRPHETRAP